MWFKSWVREKIGVNLGYLQTNLVQTFQVLNIREKRFESWVTGKKLVLIIFYLIRG